MDYLTPVAPAQKSFDLYFLARLPLHDCLARLRDAYQFHQHIQLEITASDLVPDAKVVTLTYYRQNQITGYYACLLCPWENGETLVQGPIEARLHRDRQYAFPSRMALLLGGFSWLILLGTAFLLRSQAYQALAFAGFALFAGLALVIMRVMATEEPLPSPDSYLLRDLLKTSLTARIVKRNQVETLPTAATLRHALHLARRPAHLTGRSPLVTDKQRGHFPTNHHGGQ